VPSTLHHILSTLTKLQDFCGCLLEDKTLSERLNGILLTGVTTKPDGHKRILAGARYEQLMSDWAAMQRQAAVRFVVELRLVRGFSVC
jgi:hypothetical protein